MNCANHPDKAAIAFCRTCGKPMCESCQKPAHGTVFCEEHLPVAPADPAAAYSPYANPYPPPGATPYGAPYPTTPASTISPGLAFVLGLIPGVGAIYNGQYAKGVIHVVILGILISIANSGAAGGFEPLFALLIPLWFFYMAFEAYHTAVKRMRGEPVDEFSSIVSMQRPTAGREFPVGPVLLIALGVIFLLNTLEIVRMYQIIRFWPLFLIALGAYMLYVRLTDRGDESAIAPESVPPAMSEERRV
jgi:hypothetical protein